MLHLHLKTILASQRIILSKIRQRMKVKWWLWYQVIWEINRHKKLKKSKSILIKCLNRMPDNLLSRLEL